MALTSESLLKLQKQLFPNGRVFRIRPGGVKERLLNAVNKTIVRTANDSESVLDAILPDNPRFTVEYAEDWERRLGIYVGPGTTLADRKAAIIRKMNHPGDQLARQNWRWIEYQLQLAGFNLYVYENRFPDGGGGWETNNPLTHWPTGGRPIQLGDGQLGDNQLGYEINDIVVNSLDNAVDQDFDIGDNLRSTFFIAGASLGDFGDVPAARRTELRQLILKLKPVQTVAFLFVNYT